MSIQYMSRAKISILFLSLSIFSLDAWADSYHYQADVKGMVCAFCAYNVGKNIGQLPGVDIDSIDVDLVDANVTFDSSKKVLEIQLRTIFTDSGFDISNLTLSKNEHSTESLPNEVVLDITLDVYKVAELSTIIEAVGLYATNNSSRIILRAPASEEKTILGPLLLGRQEVLKIRFIPTESEKINLQLLDSTN